eukprot:1211773-Pleurochrysis_carterae.AAC.2
MQSGVYGLQICAHALPGFAAGSLRDSAASLVALPADMATEAAPPPRLYPSGATKTTARRALGP